MTWCCFRCLHNCSQMDTRFSKRGRKAEDNEANPKLLHAVEEDLAQECEEVPIHPKKKKLIKYSPRKTMSPTGALELAKLKEQTKMDRQKIEHLEERINYLEEAIKDLKADKDVLLAKIKEAPSTLTSSGKERLLQNLLHLRLQHRHLPPQTPASYYPQKKRRKRKGRSPRKRPLSQKNTLNHTAVQEAGKKGHYFLGILLRGW
uniref:uncharacterized protein LOC120812905 isoform X1 n=1 Tax=Gasterosteus aculeatus aculeatus TaxID=481459 RepID=UPI001A99C15D|nr:uncharacterized protein LOC120812905 isoform X1 [Gasterosteus aculeatus aculeatus]